MSTRPRELPSLYSLLGVEETASAADIKAAWRNTALRLHPDRDGGNAISFAAAEQAFTVLFDAASRESYDAQLRYERGFPGAEPPPTRTQAPPPPRTTPQDDRSGGPRSWPDPTDQAAWTNDIHREVADNSNCRPWCPNRYHSDHRSHQERLADARASNPTRSNQRAAARAGTSGLVNQIVVPDSALRKGVVWTMRHAAVPALCLMPVVFLAYSLVALGAIALPAKGMHNTLLGTQYIAGRPHLFLPTVSHLITLFVLSLPLGAGLQWLWRPFHLAGKLGVLGAITVAACCLPGAAFMNPVALVLLAVVAGLLALARVLAARKPTAAGLGGVLATLPGPLGRLAAVVTHPTTKGAVKSASSLVATVRGSVPSTRSTGPAKVSPKGPARPAHHKKLSGAQWAMVIVGGPIALSVLYHFLG